MRKINLEFELKEKIKINFLPIHFKKKSSKKDQFIKANSLKIICNENLVVFI